MDRSDAVVLALAVAGLALLAAWLGFEMMNSQHGPSWLDAVVLVLALAGLVLLAAWLVFEMRHSQDGRR